MSLRLHPCRLLSEGRGERVGMGRRGGQRGTVSQGKEAKGGEGESHTQKDTLVVLGSVGFPKTIDAVNRTLPKVQVEL